MFKTITPEQLEYVFTNKETWKEVKINYVWTVDKKTAEEIIKGLGDAFEKDPYTVRQELIDRKLINTNRGIVLDAFAALDAKFGFVKETPESEDEDNPL